MSTANTTSQAGVDSAGGYGSSGDDDGRKGGGEGEDAGAGEHKEKSKRYQWSDPRKQSLLALANNKGIPKLSRKRGVGKLWEEVTAEYNKLHNCNLSVTTIQSQVKNTLRQVKANDAEGVVTGRTQPALDELVVVEAHSYLANQDAAAKRRKEAQEQRAAEDKAFMDELKQRNTSISFDDDDDDAVEEGEELRVPKAQESPIARLVHNREERIRFQREQLNEFRRLVDLAGQWVALEKEKWEHEKKKAKTLD